MEVVIRWNRENKSLLEKALRSAGIDTQIVETQQFEGAGEIIHVIIDLASLGIAFLKVLNQRANSGKKKAKNESLATLEIIHEGRSVKITAPTEEIKRLIQPDLEGPNDKSS